MAVFPTMDIVVPQLSPHVKTGGSFISSLDVQALLAVFFRLPAHPVSVSALLPSTMLNPVGELCKNLQPGLRALHAYIAILEMHGQFATGMLSHTDMAESA